MKSKEEMYNYLEWLVLKIEEDITNLDWIGSEDCDCEFINDTRTAEDIEKGSKLIELCEYIVKLDSQLSNKITNKYNKLELEDDDDIFLSTDCVCFKYKNNYYFINNLPYLGGDTHLSIIDEFEAKEYGFIEL